MENKKLPKDDIYAQSSEDEYYPVEDVTEDLSDDDLDLSELLRKYMPEEAQRREIDLNNETVGFGAALYDEEEEDVVSTYEEYASEIFSDEDARLAAEADLAADDVPIFYDEPEQTSVFNEMTEELAYAEEEVSVDEPAYAEPAEAYAEEEIAYAEAYAEEETVYEEATAEDEYAYDYEAYAAPAEEEEYLPLEDTADEVAYAPAEEGAYEEDVVYTEEEVYSEEVYAEETYTGEYETEAYAEEAYADEIYGEDYSAYAEEGVYTEEAYAASEDEAYAASEDVAYAEEEESAPDFVNYEEQEEILDLDADIDSADINLMIAFGLDDELERTMGPEVAKKLTDELDEEQRKRDEKVRKTVDNEYMNRTQTAGFAKEYKTKYLAVRIKLAISVLFSVILFFYENLRLFGYEFDGALDGTVYPTVYIMVSLQLLLICVACAGSELIEGLKNLFTGKIEPRSVTALVVIMGIAYSVVQTWTTRIAEAPILVNFAISVSVVFTLVAEYFNLRREIFAFNIVSSKRPKHIVSKVVPAYDSAEEPEAGDTLKFESASFIDSFFTRTKEPTRASKNYAVASIVIALVAGVIAGVFSKVTGSEAAICIESSFTAFFIAVPASMLIAMSYPFYRASRQAYDNDGAIIGETSLEEYSDAGCVTFDDVGVFPSYGVRVQNVKIYNNHRIDRVLFYASSAFSVARGPLTDVFEVATMEIGHSDNVRIKAAGSGFLAVTVDDKNIVFGSAAELVSRGYWIPESVTDEDEYNEDDVSVMYMFREEKLMAKMLIKYTLDSDFEEIMSSLSEDGISVSIKTYDPNIDDDLIGAGLLKRSEYSYSVSRYDGADDGSTVKDNADSGIVSRGSAKTLLHMLSDCAKVLASRRAGITIGIISAIVSVFLMLIVILSGRGNTLSSAVIAVYQLFWMIPTFICARMYVR